MAVNHTYHTGTYNGKVLHILSTPATNICLQNLNGTMSLLNSAYYGVNGGFFGGGPLNIAVCDGNVICNNNNWCGGSAISWSGYSFKRYYEIQSANDLDAEILSNSGTWAQGGHAMRLGDPNWKTKMYDDIYYDSVADNSRLRRDIVDSVRQRTAIVVDISTKMVHLIISGTNCTFADFRSAIQSYRGIQETGENYRYYGLFLDGGGSTQMKCLQTNNTPVQLDPSGNNRALYQIIALRNNT